MNPTRTRQLLMALLASLMLASCVPDIVRREPDLRLPPSYAAPADTVNTGALPWREYYRDTLLTALIDTALAHNQELQVMLQEIAISQNEIESRKGEYLPFVDVRAGAGAEKAGEYTRNGAVEENLEVTPGQRFPNPVPDLGLSANVRWEVDIWGRLRNATKASAMRYLATAEGTQFMVTHLVAEVAASYFELMALDNRLAILDTNIAIQKRALRIVEQQKMAAKANELSVRRFQAEVLKNESRRYEIQQQITETENRINRLLGRYPQPISRNSPGFLSLLPDSLQAGLPSQLLQYRPDIRQAEYELQAAELDIDVARARFYPSLSIMGGIGYQAFSARYLVTTPESMMYQLAGELMMPLINRNAITAEYRNTSARQQQAVVNYERSVLSAYVEVSNQLAMIENMQQSYTLKAQQAEALVQSIDIANSLFLSARADYMEVLLTQRDALEARMEVVETKARQLRAVVDLYQALGGGWQ